MDKKAIILIVLAVVAVVVIIKQLGVFSSSKPKPAPPAAVAEATKADKQASGAAVLAKRLQSMPADGYAAHIATLEESDIAFGKAGFKNPMTPAKRESGRPQSWSPRGPVVKGPRITPPAAEVLAKDDSIEGIVWNDKDPLALVNNQVVGIGEELEDGGVVTDITRDTVRFSRNGQKYYLVLREE